MLLLAASGCKKKQPVTASVSPSANLPPTTEDTEAPSTTGSGGYIAPVNRSGAAGKGDWRYTAVTPPKAKAADVRKVATSPPKNEPDEKAKKKAAKEAEALRQKKLLDKRVDSSLNGVKSAIKSCFESAGQKGAQTARISFKIHRSGYVMDPSVTGAPVTTARCVRTVLSRLRIQSVPGQSVTVQRTLRYR
jgi:hypothetical protein